MKPVKVLYFVIAVMIFLSIIMFAFPKNGIKINNDFTLHFPTFEEMFMPSKIEYADISKILENQINIDSISEIIGIGDSITNDTIKADAQALIKSINRLEFPDGDKSNFYSFCKKLLKLKNSGKLIRIMHYGDSQIEGDRITSFLRYKLQNKFGGSGVGLMPAIQPYDFSFSINQTNSENWDRYTIYGRIDTNVKHKRYGALAAFSRFAPIQNDSVLNDEIIYESWINFQKSRISYSNTKKFKQCRIFYGYNKKPVLAEIYKGENLLKSQNLIANENFNVFSYTFPEYSEEVSIKFKGKDSPNIYGVALDDTKGIAVDNIALRGCAGTIFNKMDRPLLKQMYDNLNVDLLILQFGGNVMPYIDDEKESESYGRWFYSQLATLKRLRPGVSIIVIGPSDMSIKVKDKFVTYELLESVRDALKNATFKAGCAYWDMYEAMGGKNSMPSWVNAKPALAAKDYTHFSTQGSKVVANMFYNAFILEYQEYLNKKK